MAAQAVYKIILENGGMILNSQMIKRIIIEDGAAKGVEIEDGTVIEADKAVVSSIDPFQTFLKLVGEENLDKDFMERVKDWKWEEWSLFGVHLALEEAPNFTAAASDPEINKAFIYILGYETSEDFINHYQSIARGELMENAGFNCCFPTVHDPSQAPPGRHTGLISQMVPYRLKEGAEKWYSIKFKEEVAEKRVAMLQKYAPNMTKDKILWRYISTPIDVENKFLDMVEGSIKQGAYLPFQMGYLRPNEFCSQNRTPIKNLYVCGASCYPGGTVLWGGGYLGANTIVEDLGIEKWWPEPEMVTRARKSGLL